MPCVVLCLQRESYSMTQMTFRMLFCRRIFFVERPSHFFFWNGNFSISFWWKSGQLWSWHKQTVVSCQSWLFPQFRLKLRRGRMNWKFPWVFFNCYCQIMLCTTAVLQNTSPSRRLLRRGIPTLIPSKWNHHLLTQHLKKKTFFAAFQWCNCPRQCFLHSTLRIWYFWARHKVSSQTLVVINYHHYLSSVYIQRHIIRAAIKRLDLHGPSQRLALCNGQTFISGSVYSSIPHQRVSLRIQQKTIFWSKFSSEVK